MGGPRKAREWLSTLKSLVFGAAIAGILPASPSAAQQPATPPKTAFDVVSARRLDGPAQVQVAPGVFTANVKNCQYLPERVLCQDTLLNLMKEAYQVDYIQLDYPKWMNDQQHIVAIQGIIPPGTTKETARAMLRQVLAERLSLKVHWEKRLVPVYALVPGKHGVKLQPPHDPADPKPERVKTPVGTMTLSSSSGPGQYFAVADPLDVLASNMRGLGGLDRPVVNMTGLTGRYRIDLHWTPEEPDKWPDPGIVTAVQEQLGLRLEKRTLPYEVLVVDHCEQQPSAN